MCEKLNIIALLATILISSCMSPVEPDFNISISITVYENEETSLYIFSASGNKIATLIDKRALLPGHYLYAWNGKNDDGENVIEGIYYFQLEKRIYGDLIYRSRNQFIVN